MKDIFFGTIIMFQKDLAEMLLNISMKSQKTMARESGKFNTTKTLPYEGTDTEFLGYIDTYSSSKILAMFKDSNDVKELKEGDEAILILDKSPFYAE